MHPYEMLLNSFGAFLGLFLSRELFFTRENKFPLSFVWLLIAVSHFHTAAIHSGLNVSFIAFLPSFFPFTVDCKFHDDHHRLFFGNYGGGTKFLDWFFKTELIEKEE